MTPKTDCSSDLVFSNDHQKFVTVSYAYNHMIERLRAILDENLLEMDFAESTENAACVSRHLADLLDARTRLAPVFGLDDAPFAKYLTDFHSDYFHKMRPKPESVAWNAHCARYENNANTATYLGYDALPEYCVGDIANATFVTHDTNNGTYWFHD